MKKRWISLALVFCMVLTLLPVSAFAADIVASGECGADGNNVTWTLDSNGLLTISGNGEMKNYNYNYNSPWYCSCDSVQSVNIAHSVTSIGSSAFSGCRYLTSITIPDSVTSIGDYAFQYCNNLTSITIPDSVTSIGERAFNQCGLTSITIPNSVMSIGASAFQFCSLTWIEVGADNSNYCSVNGVLFDHQMKTLICFPMGKQDKMYTIPGSVTSIGDYAFFNCISLTSITIPSNVTSIGDYAFDNCIRLTGITIPDGVTSIGSYAFENCIRLTGITIPDGVTSIGSHAFDNCIRLTSITIPDGVTSIGSYAFSKCSSLTSITIPEGVPTIGDCAFYDCSSLTSITIPDSVTSIGGSAFSGCSSLTSITIPDSVTSIGSSAFWGCRNLTSITIPDGVTSIGDHAFRRCSSLTSITIPDSVTSIGDLVFYYCDSLTDVYYSGTQDQWNDITIGADNSGLKNATIHYNYQSGMIKSGKYCIRVVDENGASIPGATVTWNSSSALTDSNGCAYFPLVTDGQPSITVEKDKYDSWTNAHSNWEKSADRYSTVVLYPTGTGSYRLASAQYSNYASMSPATDLLVKVKKLSLKNTGNLIGDLDFGNFYLRCQAGDEDQVARYELYQNAKKIAETTTGSFGKLSVDQFSAGGGCFIRVVGKDGTKRDTAINLEFTGNEIVKEFTMSLDPGGVSVNVPDTVPFVGGSSLDVQFPVDFKAFPVISMSENKLKLGFNVNLLGNDTDQEAAEKNNETLDQVKSIISYMSKSASQAEKNSAWVSLKTYMNKKTPVKFFKSCDVDFIGYVEADLGSKTAEGAIVLAVEPKVVGFDYNTFVMFVPVTVQIDFSVEGELQGKVKLDLSNATWSDGLLDLNITPKLKAFGGVGFSKAIGVGAYGSADLAFKTRLIGTPKGVQSVDLTGELGIKAYVASLVYEKPFGYKTWNLYTATNVKSLKAAMRGGEAWDAGLQDASQYVPQDLSYLQQESAWNSGAAHGAKKAARADSGKTAFETLLSDTYRNAQPVMISTGDALLGAFVRADLETGSRYVSVTRYDGSVWQEPVRVDADAILDNAPRLCCSDGHVWLAYARTTEQPGDSLLSYAAHQEIVVGEIDPETLAFTELAAYPGSSYACLPELAVVNGAPTLVWLDADVADENSVLMPPSGTICAAVWNNETWSEAETVTTVSTPVSQLVAGETAIGYVSDDVLYAAADGSSTALAENVRGTVRWCAVPGADHSAFVWNDENVLRSSAGDAIPAAGITGEYAVIGNDLYYSAAGDRSANLTVLKYVNGVWSAPIRLTDGERYLEKLSAAEMNGAAYVFGMYTSADIQENAVEDAKNLVWSRVMAVNDLAIEALTYQDEGAAPGEMVPVTATVRNAGDHTVQSAELWMDGSSAAVCTDGILPGQSADLTFELPCPEKLTNYEIEVLETGMNDFNADDNVADFSLGYADAALSLSSQKIGSTRSVMAYLVNEGIDTASGTVTFYDEAGEEIFSETYENLDRGEAKLVECVLPEAYADWEGTVTAVAAPDGEERNVLNNSASVDVALLTESAPAPSNPFTDVPDGKFFTDAVLWAVSHDPQITTGVTDTTFMPDRVCTRAHVVTFLWRANGCPEPKSTTNPFKDVTNEKYYTKAVLWASEQGITTGYSDGTFRPDAECTRAQVVTFLWRANGSPNPTSTTNPFKDVSASAYYFKAVLWALETGVTTGKTPTTFNPDGECTRAHVVTFLYRDMA